jgi:hypothetical protein
MALLGAHKRRQRIAAEKRHHGRSTIDERSGFRIDCSSSGRAGQPAMRPRLEESSISKEDPDSHSRGPTQSRSRVTMRRHRTVSRVELGRLILSNLPSSTHRDLGS